MKMSGKKVKGLSRKFWLHLPFGCFVVAVLCLCFAYGVAVGKWNVFPYRFLNSGWDSLKELRYKPQHFILPARYEGEGVVVCEHEQVCPGVTLLTGPWKNGDDLNLGLRLIDLNGKVLHEWPCNPRDLWPQSPHNDCAKGSMTSTTFIHGALLLPDADVIFSFEYYGLVRLNSKSEVIWKLPYRTHHSVFQDDEGHIWVCGAKWHEDYVPEFPCLKPPFLEDIILKVSPNGTIEREISVLESMYRSGYYGLLFVNQTKGPSCYNTGDVLHFNDVEVLSERKADAFDLFQAGDIMVSMRHINTVFVIDGKTERIKWSLTYPFIAQHDPDFTEDGYITVFDNHIDKPTPLSEYGGSRILRIEPSTKEVTVLYGCKKNQYFFSFRCGKHQHLPNGNMLITEPQAGRVFEITADGKIVWDWLASRWNENNILEILEGTRYNVNYAGFTNNLRKDEK
jgi:hypothetical protein